MEPIISPWVVWAISCVDGIKILLVVLAVIVGMGGGMAWFIARMDDYEWATPKMMAAILTTAVLLAIGAIAVPDKRTIAAICLAKVATPDNIKAISEPLAKEYQDAKRLLIEQLTKGDKSK